MKLLFVLIGLLSTSSAFSAGKAEANLTVSATIVDACIVSTKNGVVLLHCSNGTTSTVIPKTNGIPLNDGPTITVDKQTNITTILW